jgi:hypothetical protein
MKMPNNVPDPTSPSVTPPAGAGGAPSVVASLSYLAYDIVRRRREGQSWNEALAQGSKLLTGNVWLDGALFIVVLAAPCALIVFAMLHTW